MSHDLNRAAEPVGDCSGPHLHPPSSADPATARVPPTRPSTPSLPVAFELLKSAVYELWAAVNRADPNVIALLKDALVRILRLGDIVQEILRVEKLKVLRVRLRAVIAIAGVPIADTGSRIQDHVRAIYGIICRLWKGIEACVLSDDQSVLDTRNFGIINVMLDLLASFLEAFEVGDEGTAEVKRGVIAKHRLRIEVLDDVQRRLGIICKRLEEKPYALRIVGIASNPLKIINNNSNATYNFGGEVVNKNSVNIFVFSDGADYKTPDLVKKQEKVIKEIKNAIGNRFVREALHIAQPEDAGCMEGTRKEVLKKFLSWVINDPNRIFWLAGLAGMGKTSIALTLCRQLQRETQVILGGAFFCSRTSNKEERTDPSRILPTLATIMAEQSPEFATGMEKELGIGANPHAAFQPANVQAECLLRKPLDSLSTSSRTIVFVVDALDECIDEGRVGLLLKAIATLARSSRVKFILTSRPETHIAYHPIFQSAQSSILRLHTIDKAEVTKDIQLYIRKTFPSEAWYTEEDITALATRADGVFIFASTMTTYVLDGRGPNQRRDRLQDAKWAGRNNEVAFGPLDEMYDLVLTRASDGKKVKPNELKATLQALACILAAREPISVAILADLLERDAEDLRGSLERLYAVLYVPEDINERAIRTVHASFGDYLFERAAGEVRISHSYGDEELARECLHIMENGLHFNISQSKSSCEFNQNTRPDSATLSLEYACLHWVDHVSRHSDPPVLDQMISDVFPTRTLFWLEVMSVLGHIQHALSILNLAAVTVQSPELLKFLRDTHAFLTSFREPIERSAPHIYLSALPFEPKDSLVYRTFSPHCTGLVIVDVLGLSHARDVCNGGHTVKPLQAHGSSVNSIAVSPDSTTFVSGSDDHSVRIWDARTGDQKFPPLLGHGGSVYSVAIAPNGSMIASASEDRTVRLWYAQTGASAGEPLRGHNKGVTSVKFSPDSRWVISGSNDGTVRIWDVATRRPSTFSPLQCHSGVSAVAFTPDGQTVASGDGSGHIYLWKAANGDLLRTWQVRPTEQNLKSSWRYDEGILSIEFSRAGTHILSVGRLWACGIDSIGDMEAQEKVGSVWDVATGQCNCVLKGNRRVDLQQVLTYSADWRLIASGSAYKAPDAGCGVRLWDAKTGQIVATASTRGNSARSVALTPNGQSIMAGFSSQILVWDVWEARMRFIDHTGDAVAALTDNLFFDKSDRTNWIIGSSSELLLWVPPEYQLFLQGGAIKLVIGPARVCITRDPNGLHYGTNWTLCWQDNVTNVAFPAV